MARKDPVTDLIKYMAVGTGTYIFYSAGRNGRFGSDIQKMMNGIHDALSPLLSGAWNLGGTESKSKDTSTIGARTYPYTFPQNNGNGTFSVVQENPQGTWTVLYGPTTQADMEAWFTRNYGTFKG